MLAPNQVVAAWVMRSEQVPAVLGTVMVDEALPSLPVVLVLVLTVLVPLWTWKLIVSPVSDSGWKPDPTARYELGYWDGSSAA